jgi:hypothetical protein
MESIYRGTNMLNGFQKYHRYIINIIVQGNKYVVCSDSHPQYEYTRESLEKNWIVDWREIDNQRNVLTDKEEEWEI